MHIGYGAMIIYGVTGIKNAMEKSMSGFVKNNLIIIHAFNFIIFSIMFMTRSVLQIESQPENF